MEETKDLSNAILGALRTKGLTLPKLAETTGISERFLSSFVEGKFENLPAVPYIRGYLMKIAEVLDLDGEQLFRDYLKDNKAIKRSGRHDRLPENRFATGKLNVKLIFLVLIILGILLYILLKIPLVRDVNSLIFYNLNEEITYTNEPNFMVWGRVGRSYKLTLNGERIYPNEDGNFGARIKLQDGWNTLTFSLKKFLGKERTITKQIFYKKEPAQGTIQNVAQ